MFKTGLGAYLQEDILMNEEKFAGVNLNEKLNPPAMLGRIE